MSDSADVQRRFDAIAEALSRSDPLLATRAHHAIARERVVTMIMVALLYGGSVSMVIGLATYAWWCWWAGLLAVLVTPIVAEIAHRRDRRSD